VSGARQIHSEATDVLRGKSAVCGLNGHRLYYIISLSKAITFAKVIPPDPLPEEVGERFEFSWIVPEDRPWKVGDRLAVKFFEFGELLQ
jgi:hypothetical protein